MKTYILTLTALLHVPLAALHAASPFLERFNLEWLTDGKDSLK